MPSRPEGGDSSALPLAAVVEDCAPAIRRLAQGRYAIAIGGSIGKGTADRDSDIDFRLYCDAGISPPERWHEAWAAFVERTRTWEARGIRIDGCWVRRFADIETALAAWLAGTGRPEECTWTIWGYHLLPDLFYQRVVEDPDGVLASWKARLQTYPPALKQAVLDRHLGSLRYWANDYHYAHKVLRRDVVFLAGLTARLVHDVMQVVFALNESYFPGDGSNLEFVAKFRCLPPNLGERLQRILYPPPSEQVWKEQRQAILDLVADVERLVAAAGLTVRSGGP